MKKRISTGTKRFVQGYICACAAMLQAHGISTEVEDILRGVYQSIDDLRRHEVDEQDIEVLMPLFEEIERKRVM